MQTGEAPGVGSWRSVLFFCFHTFICLVKVAGKFEADFNAPVTTSDITLRRPRVVGRDEAQVRDKIKEMLEARLAGHLAEIWPTKSGEIPDKEPAFLIAYLPLEFAAETKTEQQRIGKELLEKFGDKPRQFRSGLGLAIRSRFYRAAVP